MPEFVTRKGALWCEGVRVRDMAERTGTPVYIYSAGAVRERLDALQRAFASVPTLVCYALKVNNNLSLCRMIARRGAGADVVSGGELYVARRAGFPANRIVFAGVGKRPEEIREALRERILLFNVESEGELEVIEAEASRLGRTAEVALRINPDVDPDTHHYIATGRKETKFGIHEGPARRLIRALARRGGKGRVTLSGLHMHLGSQIASGGPYVRGLKVLGRLAREARAWGHPVWSLDVGGGLGIRYRDERPQTAAGFARAILPAVRAIGARRLILEPGRFIVGNAGLLVTRVLYRKQGGGKQFIVVDAGMNDLIRPSLYGAHHGISPVEAPRRGAATEVVDVVGPVCESGDFLAKSRRLPRVDPGALLAVMGAGAYGFVMASNYNARLRPAEVLVSGGRWQVVRRRERREDLLRGQRLIEFPRPAIRPTSR